MSLTELEVRRGGRARLEGAGGWLGLRSFAMSALLERLLVRPGFILFVAFRASFEMLFAVEKSN